VLWVWSQNHLAKPLRKAISQKIAQPPTLPVGKSNPPKQPHHQRNDERGKEQEKQDLRDSGGCSRYSSKPKEAGNDGYDQKYQGIVQHRFFSFESD
jgi:hypothetical protein